MIQTGLSDYLFDAVRLGASDLHVTAGLPPMVRVHGKVQPLDYPPLTPNATRELIYDILSNDQRQRLENEWELDFSYSLPRTARFRVNVYFQRGALGAAFRTVPSEIKSLGELGLPKVVEDLTEKPRGLVLVTGPTGSGKSTTLAAMIDKINRERRGHIITVEDPIEFIHRHQGCMVNQREVGSDTQSFARALKYALRQDPDVILVGEMRDLETTSAAITAAETGHLVFSTLHTVNAPQTIERIIDVYPADEQNQIRSMLANTLQAVISQTLFKRADQPGMIPGVEIMLCTPAVRNCVRENRIFEIPNIIATSRALGMQSLDDSIKQLYVNGYISREDAIAQAAHPEKLERSLAA